MKWQKAKQKAALYANQLDSAKKSNREQFRKESVGCTTRRQKINRRANRDSQ